MPEGRPAIPIEIKRDVLFEARHHCAVCCSPLPLEFAHVVPWSKSRDHSLENLIALCANCHERADKEKWGVSYLERYKKSPCIIARGAQPMTVEQKALVDLIVARDPEYMSQKEKQRLVSMLAAYLDVPFEQISVVSVTQANSSRVRLEMPLDAARRLVEDFERHAPMLHSFLSEAELVTVENGPPAQVRVVFTLRGKDVMLAEDVARIFGVGTASIMKVIQRNPEIFSEQYAFELTKGEVESLRLAGLIRTIGIGGGRALPWAITKKGIMRLAIKRNSKMALELIDALMDAFDESLRQKHLRQGQLTARLSEPPPTSAKKDDA